MSDANQPYVPVGPTLSVNLDLKQVSVAKVLNDLEDLDKQKEELENQIAIAVLKENTSEAEKLGRQLASVESAIELRDSTIKARHGHMHRRPVIDST